jgi:1,2-diacylglycerol 3-alpha-glucosyltransferase
MNIGIFTESYYPEVSGVVTSINALKKELKKRGHNVYIFTTTNPLPGSKMPGVFRLPSMSLLFYRAKRIGIFYMPRAAKCVKKMKLDIIHTQTETPLGIFGKIMAKQIGIPVVHTYHVLWKDYLNLYLKGKFIKRPINNIAKILSRIYCNNCEAVIAPTQKIYDLLTEYGVEKPIDIIPTGIELDRFRKENITEDELLKLKESFGIKKDDPIIIFVGRVANEKSIDIVLRQFPNVLKKIPNVKFLIVGGGPATDDLKILAKQLKVDASVIFTGEQRWEQIGKFYRLGDVFVSSSVTETQGLTIIEAMASDIPVIAKNDRNVEELIQNNINGRLFKSDSELTEILIEVLKNKELCDYYILNAKKTVEEYSSEKFGQRIENLYFKVLENKVKIMKKDHSRLKNVLRLKIKHPKSNL